MYKTPKGLIVMPQDLEITTYESPKTDIFLGLRIHNEVKILHKPTGFVAISRNWKSEWTNRKVCLHLLFQLIDKKVEEAKLKKQINLAEELKVFEGDGLMNNKEGEPKENTKFNRRSGDAEVIALRAERMYDVFSKAVNGAKWTEISFVVKNAWIEVAKRF